MRDRVGCQVVTVFVTKKALRNAPKMELAMLVFVGRWTGIRKRVGFDKSTSIFWGIF